MYYRERCFTALLVACLIAGGCFGHKKKPVETDNSNAPDKVLYERAMNDIQRGRHEVGRLTLQTLINTYPDSDHLADAKLAIADSYFKEGGRANMTQAIAGYKDYLVFFPFLDKAAYAQMQVGMAHYRMMEKPDRDRSEAKAAEEELQRMLQKYPNSPYAKQAEQLLRDVQEVLAEGDFRVGNYYYIKGNQRAAASRLMDVTNRYPLYSRSDRALWMLGTIFEKNERKEIAAQYYARILRNYPLSELVPDAKEKLTAWKVPIPQADPQALAWQQKEREVDRGGVSLLRKATGVFRTGPDVRTAARSGAPNLTPASEAAAGGDVLRPGGATALGGAGANTALVETVTPGAAGRAPSSNSGGAETAPEGSGAENAPATNSTGNPAAGTGDPATSSNPAKPDANASSNSQAPGTQAGDASKSDSANGKKDGDKKKESSSKKKKGLRKIVPW
jgi:outer membrane protein assembly factor BamD